jgi:hypothetical protein
VKEADGVLTVQCAMVPEPDRKSARCRLLCSGNSREKSLGRRNPGRLTDRSNSPTESDDAAWATYRSGIDIVDANELQAAAVSRAGFKHETPSYVQAVSRALSGLDAPKAEIEAFQKATEAYATNHIAPAFDEFQFYYRPDLCGRAGEL